MILEDLVYYTKLGFHIFPIQPGLKIPYEGTSGFKDATTDVEVISDWLVKYPNSNWAVATGEKSGIAVLDIDPRNGGIETMEEFVKDYGNLPETPCVETGGKGYHYYFRQPVSRIKSKKIGDGVDVKTTGGYIIIPPSKTDNPYEWLVSFYDAELSDLPGWIITLSAKKEYELDEEGRIKEGSRNDYLASMAGRMRRHGFSQDAIKAALKVINKERCVPSLSTSEVNQIASSISSYEPEDENIDRFIDGEDIDLNIKEDALESEFIVIGYMISQTKDEVVVGHIFSELEADQFQDETNRRVYSTLKRLWEEQTSMTLDHVVKSMDREKVASKEYLDKYQNSRYLIVKDLADIKFNIKRILDAWTLVQSTGVLYSSLMQAKKGFAHPKDIIADTTKSLYMIGSRHEKSTMRDSKELARDTKVLLGENEKRRNPGNYSYRT